MSDVAALIVNWNAGSMLATAVESLISGSDAEVVVVDNASSDGSAESVAGIDPRVRVVRNKTNAGFAGGVNRGFLETRTPYVLVLNPDVRVRPGAIAALRTVLERHARAGAVGGFVNSRYLPRQLPTLGSLAGANLGVGPGTGPEPEALVRVEQPAAAALLVRRAAFDAVGGFDERFHPAWYEDVDFFAALRQAGWEAYFEPAARFDHEGGYSAVAMGTERFMAAYYTNQFRYARKHLGVGSVPFLKGALVAGVVLRSLARPSGLAGYWRGLWQVISG